MIIPAAFARAAGEIISAPRKCFVCARRKGGSGFMRP
jgi:hypothetical protein